jgi:hypothetical protein
MAPVYKRRPRVWPRGESAFQMIDREAERLGEKHYACSWHGRRDGLYHICVKQKREWKVKL